MEKQARVLRMTAFLMVLASMPFVLSCKGGDGPKIRKTPEGFTVYTDEINHFKLAHPANWKLTAFKAQGGCNISMPVAGALFVKTRKMRESDNMTDLAGSFKRRLSIWGDKLVMHMEKTTTLSGKSARLYVYTMKSEYGDKTQYVIFTLAGGRYYELIFDGSPKAYEQVKDKLQMVVDTFHITG